MTPHVYQIEGPAEGLPLMLQHLQTTGVEVVCDAPLVVIADVIQIATVVMGKTTGMNGVWNVQRIADDPAKFIADVIASGDQD